MIIIARVVVRKFTFTEIVLKFNSVPDASNAKKVFIGHMIA